MELHQLRTFIAVAEMQHLTQAAERLHMSQPAASAHIKALEQDLKLELFERRAGGLALTPAGHDLLVMAREVLAATAMLRSKAQELLGRIEGTIRLGVRVDMQLTKLGEFVMSIRRSYPGLDLKLYQLRTLSIIGGVQTGELDAGFALVRELPPGLAGFALREIPYCVVAPVALAGQVIGASAEVVSRLPWIAPPRGGSYDQMLTRLFAETSAALNFVVESDHEAMHEVLVKSGVGLSLMPEARARAAEERGAAVIWNAAATSSTLRFIYSDRRSREPAINALRTAVVENWNSFERTDG